jgi:hypothetical protein
MVCAWLVLLGAVVTLPFLTDSASLADDLTRYTVRITVGYCAVAAALMFFLGRKDWAAGTARGRFTRWCWTLAWAAYLVHLFMAFHYYHRWSHADAVRHTQEVSGFGNGIYVSHAFTLLWSADVVYWWLHPVAYAARAPWFARLLYAFMAFMFFNATVTYEQGAIRWAGVAIFTGLAVLWVWRRLAAKSSAPERLG